MLNYICLKCQIELFDYVSLLLYIQLILYQILTSLFTHNKNKKVFFVFAIYSLFIIHFKSQLSSDTRVPRLFMSLKNHIKQNYIPTESDVNKL